MALFPSAASITARFPFASDELPPARGDKVALLLELMSDWHNFLQLTPQEESDRTSP